MSDDADDQTYDYHDESVDSPDHGAIWQGSQGQLSNFGTYLTCICGIVVVFLFAPPRLALIGGALISLVALTEYLKVCFTRYELTGSHLTKRWGVLTTRKSPIPLYRIEDSGAWSPFFHRLFGRGHVYVLSSDRSDPKLHLKSIPNPEALEDLLRKQYEIARSRKGTRVIE